MTVTTAPNHKNLHQFQTIIAIGSNIGDREQYVRSAIKEIGLCFGEIAKTSNFYETPPMGNNATFPFLNGAVLVRTPLAPEDQMLLLLKIETKLGRKRKLHWGNRTIDLDIVTIIGAQGPVEINSDILICPHPHMHLRDFVLIPTCELLPEGLHTPTQKTFSKLLEQSKFDKSFKGVKKDI